MRSNHNVHIVQMINVNTWKCKSCPQTSYWDTEVYEERAYLNFDLTWPFRLSPLHKREAGSRLSSDDDIITAVEEFWRKRVELEGEKITREFYTRLSDYQWTKRSLKKSRHNASVNIHQQGAQLSTTECKRRTFIWYIERGKWEKVQVWKTNKHILTHENLHF